MPSFNDLVNADRPVLVDFTASWCGPCQQQAPILQQLASEMGDAVRILKIDVDKNQALAQEQRVQGVPTLMLWRQGKLLWRQSGVQSLTVLREQVRRAQQGAVAHDTLYSGRMGGIK